MINLMNVFFNLEGYWAWGTRRTGSFTLERWSVAGVGVAGGVLSLGICKGENTRMRGLKQFCFVALKIKVRIMAGGVYLFCLKGFLIFPHLLHVEHVENTKSKKKIIASEIIAHAQRTTLKILANFPMGFF